LLGVQAANFAEAGAQLDLLEPARDERWQKVQAAADHLRDKFGESAIGLATGMKGTFRERTHENPVGLPGKQERRKTDEKPRDARLGRGDKDENA
jgi:DNA polymerase-4